MFDRVWVACPNCGKVVEFQSKAGECDLLRFNVDNAPVDVLIDIMNDPECCDCGTWLAVIDPRAPASIARPEVALVKVKPPENPVIHFDRQYWPVTRAFTKDDIEDNQ